LAAALALLGTARAEAQAPPLTPGDPPRHGSAKLVIECPGDGFVTNKIQVRGTGPANTSFVLYLAPVESDLACNCTGSRIPGPGSPGRLLGSTLVKIGRTGKWSAVFDSSNSLPGGDCKLQGFWFGPSGYRLSAGNADPKCFTLRLCCTDAWGCCFDACHYEHCSDFCDAWFEMGLDCDDLLTP
jgi:hypothetical protein